METYWYVKARHTDSGREIQRLSLAGGAASASEAAVEMRNYLLKTMQVQASAWQFVEVTRWSPDTTPAVPRRAVQTPESRPFLEWGIAPESTT